MVVGETGRIGVIVGEMRRKEPVSVSMYLGVIVGVGLCRKKVATVLLARR